MLDCNTYLIRDDKTIIIDTGLNKSLPDLINTIKQDDIDPEQIDIIVNTHLHLDHTWANNDFKEKYGGRIKLSPVQKKYYKTSVHDAALFFGVEPVDFQEDGFFDSSINLGNIELQIIPTPGHSPDSICFYCANYKALISGDLIFDHNTGRSDLPGGNGKMLKQSIEAVSEMDIELLLPGHMGYVQGKEKVRYNLEFIRNNVFPML